MRLDMPRQIGHQMAPSAGRPDGAEGGGAPPHHPPVAPAAGGAPPGPLAQPPQPPAPAPQVPVVAPAPLPNLNPPNGFDNGGDMFRINRGWYGFYAADAAHGGHRWAEWHQARGMVVPPVPAVSQAELDVWANHFNNH